MSDDDTKAREFEFEQEILAALEARGLGLNSGDTHKSRRSCSYVGGVPVYGPYVKVLARNFAPDLYLMIWADSRVSTKPFWVVVDLMGRRSQTRDKANARLALDSGLRLAKDKVRAARARLDELELALPKGSAKIPKTKRVPK